MKIAQHRIGFAGFGHMAQVICKALESSRLIPRSQILFTRRDPDKSRQNEQQFGVTATSLKTLIEKSDVLFLCVRPGDADPLLKECARIGVQGKTVISVLSGVKISFYQKYLGSQVDIIRAMPNIASAVGRGMTILNFGPQSPNESKSLARTLFSCMGEVAEVPEDLMDICTGMAGSGPGFVFRLIAAMARAGDEAGVAPDLSIRLAAQTFAGAAQLILEGGVPADLIRQIATPGGTTQAGYDVMKESEIEKHFQMVVEAAARKSRQFSEEKI